MSSFPKPVSKKSVKAMAKHSSVMVTTEPTGRLKPKARKVQDVKTLDNQHSRFSSERSDAYHAKTIGQPKPFNNSGLPTTRNTADEHNNSPRLPKDKKAAERVKIRKGQEKMTSTRPGRTAQRGLGG